MACGSCGKGGGRKSVGVNASNKGQSSTTSDSNQMVMVEYIGVQSQRRRIKSKVNSNHSYTFSADERYFYAYSGDIAWLESMGKEFRVAKIIEKMPELSIQDAPVIRSDLKVQTDYPIDVLDLDNITMSKLKKEFTTINQVRHASDADLLSIKGFGPSRVAQVRKAINALQR